MCKMNDICDMELFNRIVLRLIIVSAGIEVLLRYFYCIKFDLEKTIIRCCLRGERS